MILTGRQIREACERLRWSRFEVQRRTALPLVAVDIAMSGEDTFNGTQADKAILEDAFRHAGVEFTPEGPRLRKGES